MTMDALIAFAVLVLVAVVVGCLLAVVVVGRPGTPPQPIHCSHWEAKC